MELTEAQREYFTKFKYDNVWYSKEILKIQTKEGQNVPFILNATQIAIDKTIEDLRDKGKLVRLIVLKARQEGVSTYSEGKIYQETSTRENIRAEIIAHKAEASTNLFNMSKNYYDNTPIQLRPMLKASNSKELVFENPTNSESAKLKNPGLKSKIKVSTAGNMEAGRSGTITKLHVSELAFWPNAKKTMTALMQTVPETLDSLVIVESTANGVGDYFHKLWKDAVDGENDFIPLFFAWFDHKPYRMNPPDDFKLTREEKILKTLYKLDKSQIYWRRWAIKNKCNNDLDVFKQEYPSNPKEAFLGSGRPRFDVNIIADHYEKLAKENPIIAKGNIVLDDQDRQHAEINDSGNISFYRKRDDRKQYVISADVASGTANEDNKDPDYSVAKVQELPTMETVALYRERIEPALFGDVLTFMGRHYNNAVLIPERNNHGIAVLATVRHKHHYPDALIHVSKLKHKEHKQDKYSSPETRYGFVNTQEIRQVIIDNYAYKIAQKQLLWIPEEELEEHYTFVFRKTGKVEADIGCHDDYIITTCIGYYIGPEYIKHIPENSKCGNCRSFLQKTETNGYCERSKRWCTGFSYCRLWSERVIWDPVRENQDNRYKTGYHPAMKG